MKRFVKGAGAFIFLIAGPLAAADQAAHPLAAYTVEAGKHERTDVPVSVELPPGLDPWGPLLLVEISGEKRTPIACQVEAGRPVRLWWVLEGKTPAGTSRRFEVAYGPPARRPSVEMDLQSERLDVSFGGARVFSYNHAHVTPPPGVKEIFIRSGYIHPLFSPSGALLTEDFPADHHHHKGIWMPWTKTKFEGREMDFWNLGEGTATVQFAGFEGIEAGPVYGRFRANHEFVDLKGKKVALREVWDVRTWAVGGPKEGRWTFDLTSVQRCATESPLLLEKYRYGGLGFRGPKEWKDENYDLLTSEGKTKVDGHGTRGRWCAQSGSVGGGRWTVVILCHPSNERFPEHMRIWDKGGAFFSYSPVQAGEWLFKPGETHVFRYRFVVHKGKIDREAAERAYADFAEPPAAAAR
jgi:hypothetical protein